MTNEDAIEIIESFRLIFDSPEVEHKEVLLGAIDKAIEALKNEKSKCEWIPIKTRPLTEEEKKEYPDYSFMYDCHLPEDGEEVLVSTKWGVNIDIFCDCIGGCYFENYCDEDDVLAWQPLPKPYKRE